MPTPDPRLSGPVLEAARTHAYDLYLAALLAPAAAQGDLVVLAAYLGEVRRIPFVAHEPAIGEIRLQWWRDALASATAGGHPLAEALMDLKRRRSLPGDLLAAPLEGASRTFYEDGIPDKHALALYAGETEEAPIRLALTVLGAAGEAAAERLAQPAARALALTRLALTLPQHLAFGRLPLPAEESGPLRDPRTLGPAEAREATRALLERLAEDATDALAEFRRGEADLGRGALPAFLTLALVAPYLKAVVAPQRDVLSDVADISPLSRVTRLWFARWRGRI